MGSRSVGLLANNGTVDVSTPVTISMTGPNSYGVEAEGIGVVDIDPGTTVTTSGIGGFGATKEFPEEFLQAQIYI